MRPRFFRAPTRSLCHHIFLFIFSSHMALYPGFTIQTGNPIMSQPCKALRSRERHI